MGVVGMTSHQRKVGLVGTLSVEFRITNHKVGDSVRPQFATVNLTPFRENRLERNGVHESARSYHLTGAEQRKYAFPEMKDLDSTRVSVHT